MHVLLRVSNRRNRRTDRQGANSTGTLAVVTTAMMIWERVVEVYGGVLGVSLEGHFFGFEKKFQLSPMY